MTPSTMPEEKVESFGQQCPWTGAEKRRVRAELRLVIERQLEDHHREPEALLNVLQQVPVTEIRP